MTEEALAYLREHPDKTEELVRYFVSRDDVTLTQRAGMVLGWYGEEVPERLEPYFSELLEAARVPIHPVVPRNVFRVFSLLSLDQIDEALEGPLLDAAFNRLTDPEQNVTVHVYCMQIVATLVKRYPELAGELHATLRDGLEESMPGYRSRAKKIIKQLERKYELD